MRRVAVIGVGSFGSTLAAQLADKKCQVIAIDREREEVQDIKDKVTQAVVADASDRGTLEELNLKDVDVACVCLGQRIDVSILVTLHLKEMGVKRIIAQASSDAHGRALSHVGANEVIYPEKEVAIRLANSLVNPDVMEMLKVSDEFNIIEVAAPDEFYRKSIKELQLRKKYGIEILAIKNPLDGSLNVVPSPDYKVRPDDVLIAIGEMEALEKLNRK